MDNPLLASVLKNFPDVQASSLSWPAGAESWDEKDLELFIGSGGFLKPKKKKVEPKKLETELPPASGSGTSKSGTNQPLSTPELPSTGKATSASSNATPKDGPEDMQSAFETPGFSKERSALTMPVRVHCEDTSPIGHVRLESLVAFCERIRSLALKQVMGVSLADLKEKKMAILATEYVVEIVGKGFRVLDTLRIDTTPEFPSAPLFPWHTNLFAEDGSLYMRGLFGLNLCQISDSGAYSGIDQKQYDVFAKDLKKWTNPDKTVFSRTQLRFFNAYSQAGAPFKPTSYKQVTYVVRASDCDMYNVLFQARVPSMMESCHPRLDAMAFYVNLRLSCRPGDPLTVHVFADEDSALFICLREKDPVLTAFGHYGKVKPISQEAMKCASIRLTLLLKYIAGGPKPSPCEDFDLSNI